MTRVLIDYHHSDLFESFQIMFGDRFGWEVYAPYGMDWFDEGIWQFEKTHHGNAVALQYLDGIWTHGPDTPDKTHLGRMLRGVTLSEARNISWDIVISSLPDNDRGLHDLARQTGAVFGIQLGNVGQQSAWGLADFALCSTTLPWDPGIPHVIYRQPFSLIDFRYEPPPRGARPPAAQTQEQQLRALNPGWYDREPPEDYIADGRIYESTRVYADPAYRFRIGSFVQCLPENPLAYGQFLHYARSDDSFLWQVFGAYGTHPEDEFACGNLPSTPLVAAGMRSTDVIWHTKEWSDGYGHVIHNAFAVGRPVFGIEPYYRDKLAGPLWVDGETSIDISRRTNDEVLTLLRRLRDDPDEHLRMCENAARRFREVVDFDAEAEAIRTLLDNVMSDRKVAA